MRITRVIAITAFTVPALLATVMPASAHAVLASLAGTIATSGTWAPASPACGSTFCPAANSWSFISTTDVLSNGTIGSGRVSGAGTFNGWCGRSTGFGTMTLDGDSASVTWQNAGHVVVLTGSASGHTAIGAVLLIRAASGTGNCVTAPATAWDVVGTAYVF